MPEGEEPIAPEDERREIQAFLGQVHGLLDTALEHPNWFAAEIVDDLAEAYRESCAAFGVAQAALNSGAHDEDFAAGVSSEPSGD
jgi:hypothetical protein